MIGHTYTAVLQLPRKTEGRSRSWHSWAASPHVVEMCPDELGVLFTINSDAHSPEKVGILDNALAKALSAGVPASMILNAEEN